MPETTGRDKRIQPMRGSGLDVLLGEVASVRSQCCTLGQLGAYRVEVTGELLKRRLELPGVGCLVRQLGHNDHLRLAVNDRLPVEALVKRTIRRLHDPRLRVSEITLRFGLRLERVTPVRWFAGFLALLPHLSTTCCLRLTRLYLQRLLGLTDHRKTPLTMLQLLRQLITTTIDTEALVLLRVNALSIGEQAINVLAQRRDLALQLLLLLDHPLIAHRLMPRSIR